MITSKDFSELRYGMFIHFGLFSKLAHGEWVMNREQIPVSEMEKIAAEFNPDQQSSSFIPDMLFYLLK